VENLSRFDYVVINDILSNIDALHINAITFTDCGVGKKSLTHTLG